MNKKRVVGIAFGVLKRFFGYAIILTCVITPSILLFIFAEEGYYDWHALTYDWKYQPPGQPLDPKYSNYTILLGIQNFYHSILDLVQDGHSHTNYSDGRLYPGKYPMLFNF
jgi:hypothetical protein